MNTVEKLILQGYDPDEIIKQAQAAKKKIISEKEHELRMQRELWKNAYDAVQKYVNAVGRPLDSNEVATLKMVPAVKEKTESPQKKTTREITRKEADEAIRIFLEGLL